jgi:uncharacterized protein YbjT (DUF2867 family)
MRSSVAGASGAVGARLVPQLIEPEQMVTRTHRSPRNAGRVRGLSAEPTALGQPACTRPRIAGGS